MEKLGKDLIAASAVPIILSILSDRESYGYQIIKNVSELSEGRMNWKEGTLYPLLNKMEQRGLVKSEWRSTEDNRRRKYYTIEEKGREELEMEMDQWKLVFTTLIKAWEMPSNL
jgi:DNA-binding PadR family transcriptional regulator